MVTRIENIDAFKWTAYPNPASDVLLLDSPFGSGQWMLIGTDGRSVISGQAEQPTSIDVSDIPCGLYILSVEHNGVSSSKRIAIQR